MSAQIINGKEIALSMHINIAHRVDDIKKKFNTQSSFSWTWLGLAASFHLILFTFGLAKSNMPSRCVIIEFSAAKLAQYSVVCVFLFILLLLHGLHAPTAVARWSTITSTTRGNDRSNTFP